MLKLATLTVGKPDRTMFLPAVLEYESRLCRYFDFESVEVKEGAPAKSRARGEIDRAVSDEGRSLMSKLRQGDHVVALAIDGKKLTSEGLASEISRLTMLGVKRLVFVIGGSDGLSGEVLSRADQRLSMGDMTFPHQLARVMLLEQLYRAATINAGRTYHK